MKAELEQQLYDKYPLIFKQKDLSMQETAMCWGIDVGNGWYWLLDNLCSSIQSYIDLNSNKFVIKNKILRKFFKIVRWLHKSKLPYRIKFYFIIHLNNWKHKCKTINSLTISQVEATQVKEKFGGLRFYFSGGNKLIEGMVDLAELQSYSICVYCGATGDVIPPSGWDSPTCKICKAKLERGEEQI